MFEVRRPYYSTALVGSECDGYPEMMGKAGEGTEAPLAPQSKKPERGETKKTERSDLISLNRSMISFHFYLLLPV